MKLIDTHCHLTNPRLKDDVDAVLDRAAGAGVIACICAAANLAESHLSQTLAGRKGNVRFIAGIHPHEAKDAPEDYLRELENLAADANNVAIGEIGLDYHYDFSPRRQQQLVFQQQLDLAKRLGKPVVIHTREAFDDTLAILANSGIETTTVLFHSFTEGPAGGAKALDIGAMISFSGISTFANAQEIRRLATLAPESRLMVETDAPFLSPEPVRRMKTNEPANVSHVAACLAAARGMDAEEFAQITTDNAIAFFNLTGI
jgi:TatD DNase family protein